MREVVIAGAVRTAVGVFGGTLRNVPATELGRIVIKEVLERAQVQPDKVDLVIMGNALQAGEGQNPARQAAIQAGIPQNIPSITINSLCGSGMEAVIIATQKIQAGAAEIVVAGGMESMSQAPFVLPEARWGQRMGHSKTVDAMIHDGLWCAFSDGHMGNTAENVAKKYHISREEQDTFAAWSQQKAEAAIKANRFKDEIVPVSVPQRKGEPKVFDTDEFPKFGTTVETLAKLKPVFERNGTVTAGNSSGVNDAAAALLIMSKERAQELGITPMAKIEAYSCQGCEPELMGTGPIYAMRDAINKVKETGKKIDLVELNEAFASQALACLQEVEFPKEIVNVNGGAIALGHPIGCSGARVLVTLLYEMAKRDAKVGLASLCVGGGMGYAMIVERNGG